MTAPEHSRLPLPDYDHLPLAALASRIRPLRAGEVRALLSYEQQHADRPAAVQIFQARLAELEAGEPPSPGGREPGPEWPPPPAGQSKAGPATSAPPAAPPPHGVPAEPAQPKGDRQP